MPFYLSPFIRNLRAARKAANLTQEQAAECLGICTLHYSRLERGERQPSLAELARAADAFGVSAYALLDGCFPGTPGASPCSDVAALAAACSPKAQRLAYDIIALLANAKDL